MFLWRRSALTLLLVLHFVAACWASQCLSPEFRCDFVCDCPECDDELDCGYSGRGFQCDFEDDGQCGWTDQSLNAAEYSWERRQRGETLASSGPSSDYTTGTASGWFMGVKAVASESLHTAVLMSPEISQTSATCRLRLRYFLWDSGSSGLGSSPLWASVVRQDSQEAVVWRPEATSVRGWKEDTIFLGRIAGGFKLRLNSQRSQGQRGDVALDQLEFLDCALPLQVPGAECPSGTLECGREGCVDLQKVCDGTDDCGDQTDEQNCDEFRRCDFEDGLCDWDLTSLSPLKWFRTNQNNISSGAESLKGPGRDQSRNTAAGHFLYVTVPEGGLTQDWAAFQSPRLVPTNSTHPCKMVMYTHQFGPRSGGLTVLLANDKISPVWERGGALGDVWVKAEVELVSSSVFQILIMAAIRDSEYGGIAVDNIVLSPECRLSSVNDSFVSSFPDPPPEPCTQPDKMCDFHPDCDDEQDEAKCGDFSSAEGSSGWTDSSIGGQSWTLFKATTTNGTEEYLYVVKSPGQQLTEAQVRTPLLGPTGPACTLSFEYALTGNPGHIGELSLRVIDSHQGVEPKMWAFAGKTGKDPDSWRMTNLTIGARKHRFQLVFEARAVKLCPCAKIKVRNVHFLDCHADYFPHPPTALSCNFEDGLCGWYQDKSDNFDWMQLEGMDHTIGIGKSLAVDMWSWSLRGVSGRLISFTQAPYPKESCLSFYYKLYGPNTGALNVKAVDQNGVEALLWTRSGAHGNVWHEAHCPVPNQLTNFQLIFEAVRSGFDGRIAIDDVYFVQRPCSVPRLCSFESHSCGYDSHGRIHWLHRSASSVSGRGPSTDHTLETERGFYMMINTGANVLPAGQAGYLVSPFRTGSTKTECVSFWYTMGGMNPGSLTLYMKLRNGERMKMFSHSLSEGDMWRHASGNTRSTLEEWQLEFEVVGAGGMDTYVAVDDVFISSHPCPGQGAVCNLERGMCTWSNTQNMELDNLDWELTSQEADKHYSTPSSDHTLGTERGHFLFLPSTNRTAAGDNAWLLSPHLPPTRGTCLRFWAYGQSSSDCRLNVWRVSVGKTNQLLNIRFLQAHWTRFSVDITSTEEYQIVLEVIRGTAGFIGVDDIEYTVGVDCDKGITKPTPGKPDDKGGIAASIIVVILLIGSLIGLLVVYLRKRQGPSAALPPAATGGFHNDTYQPDAMQDRVIIQPAWNHPMAAAFNNVPVSGASRVTEEA